MKPNAHLLALLGTLAATGTTAHAQTSFGNGCAGGSGSEPSLALTSTPYSGATCGLEMQGPANAAGFLAVGVSPFPGVPLPLVGPGCELLVSPDVVVPFAFDAGGDALIPFTGGAAGSSNYLQVLALDPIVGTALGGMSEGLQVDFVALPPEPVIGVISPASAAPGEVITIQGGNFGTGPAEEIRLWSEDGGFAMVPLTRSENEITARMLPFAGNALPATLRIARGIGAKQTLADFGGGVITFNEDVYSHCYNPSAVDSEGESEILFTPQLPGGAEGGGCNVSGTGWQFVPFEFDVANGVICWNPPSRWCDGDELFLYLGFSYSSTEADNVLVESVSVNLIDPCSPLAANTVANAVSFAITSGFASVGIPCGSGVDFLTNKLTISCPGNPFLAMSPCSGVFVNLGAGNTGPDGDLGGIDDDFGGGTEPASPNPAPGELADFIAGNGKDFDSCAFDTLFGHTLTDFGGPGAVKEAVLEIRLEPCGSGPSVANDAINLEFSDTSSPAWAWGRAIRDLPEAAGTWSASINGPTTFCLDLSALPLADGTTRDILDELCDGELDVYVQDDTAVDFVRIRVTRCE